MINFHDYFIYNDGKLVWKTRPLSDFKTLRACNATNSNFAGKVAGTPNTSCRSATTYIAVEIHSNAYKAHRVVWEMFFGPIPEDLIVDHIDGNGENNRIDNLRLVDQVDSSHNLPKQKSNTSGIVGVCWHKAANKWQARISSGGERIDLGRYACFDQAVMVRKKAELKYKYHENHGREQ